MTTKRPHRVGRYGQPPVPPRREGYRPSASMPARYYLGAGDVIAYPGIGTGRLVALLSSPYAGGPRQLWDVEWIEPPSALERNGKAGGYWVGVADRVALAPEEPVRYEEQEVPR